MKEGRVGKTRIEVRREKRVTTTKLPILPTKSPTKLPTPAPSPALTPPPVPVPSEIEEIFLLAKKNISFEG